MTLRHGQIPEHPETTAVLEDEGSDALHALKQA
jgi:hypothetical protein